MAPERFLQTGPYAGHRAGPLHGWSGLPEPQLLSDELKGVVADAIALLPEAQRTVISLRDVEGWTSEEVCELLDVEPGHRRVLLHRARSRGALERYLTAEVTEKRAGFTQSSADSAVTNARFAPSGTARPGSRRAQRPTWRGA